MNKNHSNKVSTREYKKAKTKSKQILNFLPAEYPTGMQLFYPRHQDSFVSTVDCRNILDVGSATQGCRCRNRTLGHRPSLKQKVTQCDCRHIRPSTNSLLTCLITLHSAYMKTHIIKVKSITWLVLEIETWKVDLSSTIRKGESRTKLRL